MPNLSSVFKRARSTDDLRIDYSDLGSSAFHLARGSALTSTMNRTFMGKVWHAFTALPKNANGLLDLSKAKVLTQSLASVLKTPSDVISDFDFTFSEKCSGGLEFQDFNDFLNHHLLAKLVTVDSDSDLDCFEIEGEGGDSESISEDSLKLKSKKDTESALLRQKSVVSISPSVSNVMNSYQSHNATPEMLDQLCWTLYSKQVLDPRYQTEFSEQSLFSLWLWYVSYADTDDDGVVSVPVSMDGEELNYWLTYLCRDLLALEYHAIDFPVVVGLTFNEVLDGIISTKEQWKIDKEEFEFVIEELRSEILDGVIKKGFLYKGKRNHMKSQWRRRYCVLTLKTFAYYGDENMTDKKGQIPLSAVVSAEPYRDRNSKLTRYLLETNGKENFVLEAEDLRSRNMWIRDIRYALRCNVQMVENIHLLRAEKRRKIRKEQRRQKRIDDDERQQINQRIQEAEEANQRMNEEIASFKDNLEREEKERLAEKENREQITTDLQARLEIVTKEMNEAMQKVEREKEEQEQELQNEKNRVRELQTMRKELEDALSEEQQLRLDEEVVMKMQARLVEEQTHARERLEIIKTEQEQRIGNEIQKRAEIEKELDDHKESSMRAETLLTEYQQQLKESESQKSELYKKMAELEEKIKSATNPTFVIGSHRGLGAFPKGNN